jgi:ADP-L-glycero-D-manno-heptose 6-epimerase
MLEKNYKYTYELIGLCSRWKVPLVYASSASVYGDGPFAESDPKSPKNIYAKSKSMIDDYVEMLLVHSKSQITGLRYFNVYGPMEEHKGKMSSVMNQFKIQIDNTKKINLFEKSSSYKRDFIYIEDVIKINKHFYNNGVSGVFNCGTGRANSFMEIPKQLKNHYDFDIVEIPMPAGLKDRYQEYTQADVSRLASIGGYKEDFCTLEEGIAKYVEYWNHGVC